MDVFYMDAHMHFDLYKDIGTVIETIEKNKCYTIGMTNLPLLFNRYFEKYINLKYFRLPLGFHPELVCDYYDQLPLFLKNIDRTRYIGEIGLDFSRVNDKDKSIQSEIFKIIIDNCYDKKEKILSIHSRGAESEIIDILRGCKSKVIMHWYSGNIVNLDRAIKEGFYFSINHQMLNTVSGKKRIATLPLDKILLESDAPFTAGQNKGYNLTFAHEIYEYLAQSERVAITEVQMQIKENFRKLVSI